MGCLRKLAAIVGASALSMCAAQDFEHTRRIPNRPDRPSIREMVTEKYEKREEVLSGMLKQRQLALDDHRSGRKLLSDEELARHETHVRGLHRKLTAARQKDPSVMQLEIEEEIKLQERMLAGEFRWVPGEGMVLKEPSNTSSLLLGFYRCL